MYLGAEISKDIEMEQIPLIINALKFDDYALIIGFDSTEDG
jgi:hypothetical protein